VSLVIGGVIAGALYTLVALGLILIVRVTGAINFAQGDAGSVGTFVAIQLAGHSVGLPIGWSVLLGIVAGMAVNVVIYLLFVRRLEKVGAGPLPTMVVTIGASLIIEALLTVKFGFNPYTLSLFNNVGAVTIGGVQVPGSGTLIVISALLAIAVFAVVLYRTNFGRMLRMGASNPTLAELSGVRTVLIRVIVWAVAGAVATWGVTLFAAYQSISTSVMSGFLLTAAVAASWGAFRSLITTLVGAVSLGILLDIITRYVQSDVTYVITFGVLAVVFVIYQFRKGRLVSRIEAAGAGLAGRLTREVRPSYRSRPGLVGIEAAVVLLAMFGWVALSAPQSYSQGLAMQVGIGLTVLAALSISFRYTRRLNLGVGGFMCIGAYGYSVVGAHAGAFAGVVAALAGSFVIGCLLGLLTAGMELMFYATLTLVFTTAVPQLVTFFTNYTGGSQGLTLAAGLQFTNPVWIIVGVGVVAAVATVAGGIMRPGAITLIASGDSRLGQVNGFRDAIRLALAEGVSGLLMGLAGVLLALSVGYLDPASFDLTLSIGYVAALIVGGAWSVAGLTLGSLFYVLVPAELAGLQNYPSVVFGGVLIVAVLFAPVGLEGITTWLYVERSWWAQTRAGLLISRWAGGKYLRPPAAVGLASAPTPAAVPTGERGEARRRNA
jgi:branched-subunit amino acid ABC-type transport system permease component